MRRELEVSEKVPKRETSGGISLALEMQHRNLEAERVCDPFLLIRNVFLNVAQMQKEKEESLARAENEKESELARRLTQQLERDAIRKEEMRRAERERQKARKRALSDTTEKPISETSIEMLDEEVEFAGIRFDSVRLFHGRRGMKYRSTPLKT
jgi:eukaryotic translation initiation factor 2-alpha kinase 4